ncbi:MAG: hypothetical protein A2W08_01830 [Candidatus Rokubacteria bacterium RBG_16_73_20]|nr:MAG: hypothetical protein A2W08_01830 [Candidatus Rokubacteria bacterium RBG_16_73_20]
MKWILGLDLGPRSRGALQFARWIAEATHGSDDFVAVHVLDVDHLWGVLKYHHLSEIIEVANAAAHRELERAWPGGSLPVIEVRQALTVEDGLAEARARHRAEGLVIGRAASTEGHHLVRLGRVARRVLRQLASPVVIAPPDLVAADIGGGAVTALSALTDDSTEACRFAAAFAERAARPLALAHVANDPRLDAAAHIPRSTLDRMAADFAAAGRAELPHWLEVNDLRPMVAIVLQGDLVSSALAFADVQRAPFVVVGAHAPTGLDRVFAPRVGRELAAVSRVPVAIVPPVGSAEIRHARP